MIVTSLVAVVAPRSGKLFTLSQSSEIVLQS